MIKIAAYRSGYGMTCVQCGDLVIAPEWSEYVNERLVLNLWSCTNCGFQFDTEAHMPADAEPKTDSSVFEELYPPLVT